MEGEGDGILVSAKPGNLRISLKNYQWYSNLSLYGSGVHARVLTLKGTSLRYLPPRSVLNLETNCGTHAMMRGLHEAADINTFLNSPDPRLVGRTGRYDPTTVTTYV